MKNIFITLIILSSLSLYNCTEEVETDRYKILSGSVWQSDSLLANGVEAGGPGQMLEDFKGEIKFNKDGTGVFGSYTGTWDLIYDDTEININSDSLPYPLNTKIVELTQASLKITTGFPNFEDPTDPIKIRMTFVP